MSKHKLTPLQNRLASRAVYELIFSKDFEITQEQATCAVDYMIRLFSKINSQTDQRSLSALHRL